MYDLNSDLSETGKSYQTQTTDNNGTFELSASLSSNFVRLRSDGYYFNEVTGQLSSSQLTLYYLTNITSDKDVNINIPTNLEKYSVEYLKGTGKTFAESKAQARQTR